jgi:hypothetical protein
MGRFSNGFCIAGERTCAIKYALKIGVVWRQTSAQACLEGDR